MSTSLGVSKVVFFFLPAMISRTLVSTFSSSRTDSSTVSTLASFSLARASNSYSSSSVSVGSVGKLPVSTVHVNHIFLKFPFH